MEKEPTGNQMKTVRKCVRLSKDMDKLFQIVAKENNTTVGKYLRDSGLLLAEMSAEEKEFLQQISTEDRLKVQKKFEQHFLEIKDLIVNSTASLYDRLSERLDRVEKLLELFLYVFLYHNPALPESQKETASKSAVKRKQEILKYVDQLVEKMQKERAGE